MSGSELPEIVGYRGMAQMLGVGKRAPAVWRQRGQLPPPDYPEINGAPAWNRWTVIQWAVETDRAFRLVHEVDRRTAIDLGAEIEPAGVAS